MEKEPIKLEENWRNPDGTLKVGHPNLGAGRKKGKTIKERVREWLEEHPGDMEAFVKHFIEDNKELAWQMLEGRPHQKIGGDKENPLVIQISKEIEKNDINTLPENNSDRPTQIQSS